MLDYIASILSRKLKNGDCYVKNIYEGDWFSEVAALGFDTTMKKRIEIVVSYNLIIVVIFSAIINIYM
jgi:hypothetical protein